MVCPIIHFTSLHFILLRFGNSNDFDKGGRDAVQSNVPSRVKVFVGVLQIRPMRLTLRRVDSGLSLLLTTTLLMMSIIAGVDFVFGPYHTSEVGEENGCGRDGRRRWWWQSGWSSSSSISSHSISSGTSTILLFTLLLLLFLSPLPATHLTPRFFQMSLIVLGNPQVAIDMILVEL